jgi:trimethylamine--corrinoid protein Co-methyltransferase
MRPSLQKIHDASMTILRDVGVKFHHPEALQVLRERGVRVVGKTAFFSEQQIMDRLRQAPATFTLHARNPQHTIVLGGDRTHYAPAYGAVHIVQGNGAFRPPLLADYFKFARLVHHSSFFHVNGGILVQPADIDPETAPATLLYCSAMTSDKGVIAAAGSPAATQMVIDMMTILAGGADQLKSRPSMITPVNTLSPLQMDGHSLETLMTYATHHQPTLISPCVMAGTTGPVTLAGTIALANAEALAGIALAQMVAPGAPVVYGFQSTSADMRTGGIAIGGPERALCVAYGARLARAYGIPSRGGGADNDALDVSEQSGYESMMTMLVTRLEKVNFVLHSAGMAASFAAMSYPQFVFGLEMLGMIERYKRGVTVRPDTLAVDVIREVGPGGQFLTHKHTLKYCRGELYVPEISQRGIIGRTYDEDVLNKKIETKLESMLADYRMPPVPSGMRSELRAYLRDQGIDTDPIDRRLEAQC